MRENYSSTSRDIDDSVETVIKVLWKTSLLQGLFMMFYGVCRDIFQTVPAVKRSETRAGIFLTPHFNRSLPHILSRLTEIA